MEKAEFLQVMLRTLLVGGTMALVGFTGLFFAFRAFGRADGREGALRGIVLIIAVLTFVILSCVVLLRFAVYRQW